MQNNENSLYDSLSSIQKEISIKKMDISSLKNSFDNLLLQLAHKHYNDLMRLEKGTLKDLYNNGQEYIQFKTSYDSEKKIYYFQGSLFQQNEILPNIRKKIETNKRGNKSLKNMYPGHWYIENISKDEVSMINEVIKYELETRLINGNLIN